MIEPEQGKQRVAARRRKLCPNGDVAQAQAIEIEALQRRQLRLGRESGAALELRRGKIDDRAHGGAIGLFLILSDIERELDPRESDRRTDPIEALRESGRERRNECGDL